MITINYKSCCGECTNIKSYLNENKIMSTANNKDECIEAATTIGCQHEKVCKKYIENAKGDD